MVTKPALNIRDRLIDEVDTVLNKFSDETGLDVPDLLGVYIATHADHLGMKCLTLSKLIEKSSLKFATIKGETMS